MTMGNGEINKSELIEKYLAGGLSDKEKKLFEELKSKDTFFREAVEGLGSMDTDVALRDLYALRNQRPVWQRTTFRIAAGIAVLLTAGYLIISYLPFTPEENSLAQETEQVEPPSNEGIPISQQQDSESENLSPEPEPSSRESVPPANSRPQVEEEEINPGTQDEVNVQREPEITLEPEEEPVVTSEPAPDTDPEIDGIPPSALEEETEPEILPDNELTDQAGIAEPQAARARLTTVDSADQPADAGVANETPPITEAAPSDGWAAYRDYLRQNLVYPAAADSNNIAGTVIISLEVGTDGSTGNYTVKQGLGYGCDQEALRLVREGPAWQSARSGDTPIAQSAEVEVRFPVE